MARQLHIASVCRTLPHNGDPSAGIFVLNRLAAMAGRAQVRAVQPVPYLPLVQPLPDWARAHSHARQGLTIEHAPMLYVPGILKSLDARWLLRSIEGRIRRLHAKAPLDLIDAHFGYPEGAACVELGRRLRVPVFITVRGFENEYVSYGRVGRIMMEALRNATGIVCVSHSLARLMDDIGVDPAAVRVVHNAIDSAVYSWDDAAAARKRLDVAPTGPLIVSVGHLIARKRHHVLLEAFARLASRQPGATLVIIGGDWFEPAYTRGLRRRSEARELAGRVRFAGNLPPSEVADWLRAADVFALATAREGCCNAVLEALATGAPVVTTPVGDNAHFVEPGRNGLLVPVDDSAAMGEALASALEAGRWDRRAIAARLHTQVGDWSQVAARVLDFFAARLAQGNVGGLAAAASR
jgi:glycosyltransferase involved in cell wall biosynthesis